MPSAVVLDPEPLLAPISDVSPSGQKLALMDRNKLKEQREDFDPERDLSPEDRRNPQMAELKRKIPQWDKIIEFCTQFLGKSGKDLRAVFALIEALSQRHGFAGLRDGLRLLRRLCVECWDRMHPEVTDPNSTEELEARMGLFSFLDEELKQPFFPNVIRAIPLFQQVRQDPKYRSEAAVSLGRAFFESGFADEAVDTLHAAREAYQLKGDAKDKDMTYWYGRSLELKGDIPAALKAYSQVFMIDSNYRDVQSRIKTLRAQVQK